MSMDDTQAALVKRLREWAGQWWRVPDRERLLNEAADFIERHAAAPALAGEPIAWMTLTEEGDPSMLFFDRAEAVQYCDDGEQPTPLYEACHAGTPSGWLVVRQDGKDRFVTQSEECANGFVGSGWSKSPLYDQAALDAAVAAERARLAQDVADLHMAQSVNNQNYHADWHDGVDAALAVIRGA